MMSTNLNIKNGQESN